VLLSLSNALPDSALSILLLLSVCFVAGMVRGFSGFGSVMIMAPVFSALYGPTIAVPVVVLTDLIISLPLVRSVYKDALAATVRQMLLAAICGSLAGFVLLRMLPGDTLATLVAITVLVFVGLMALPSRLKTAPIAATARQNYLAGSLSGMFGSISGMSGPPAVLLMLRTSAPSFTVRATLIVYFMLIDSVLVAMYTVQQGRVEMAWLALCAISLIPMMFGAWLGSRLFHLASEQVFRKLTLALIACSALVALFL